MLDAVTETGIRADFATLTAAADKPLSEQESRRVLAMIDRGDYAAAYRDVAGILGYGERWLTAPHLSALRRLHDRLRP